MITLRQENKENNEKESNLLNQKKELMKKESEHSRTLADFDFQLELINEDKKNIEKLKVLYSPAKIKELEYELNELKAIGDALAV